LDGTESAELNAVIGSCGVGEGSRVESVIASSVLSEVNFVVEEQAQYEESLVAHELSSFILKRAPALLEQGVLDKTIFATLKAIVKRSEAIEALQLIESECFTERDVRRWHTGSSCDPESGSLIDKPLSDIITKELQLQGQQAEITRVIASQNEHIKTIFQNQARLRENIKSLENMTGSELVKRYMHDLDKEEDDLIQTRKQIEGREIEQAKVEAELKEIILHAVSVAQKAREKLEEH